VPVERCQKDGKPGYRWGGPDAGTKCYTYTAGDEASRKKAKRKAYLQGAAIGKAKADDEPLTDQEYKRRRSASLKLTQEATDQMESAMATAGADRVRGISQAEWDAALVEDQAEEESGGGP
jgi:hypothetical protein